MWKNTFYQGWDNTSTLKAGGVGTPPHSPRQTKTPTPPKKAQTEDKISTELEAETPTER